MEHRLPYSTVAAGEARRLGREYLHGRLDEARAVEVLVMISELVGNAVRHGKPEVDGRVGLRLEADVGLVRVVVTDAAPEFEFERDTFDKDDMTHFGLLMVDGLADRWGLSLDGKKAVWFEVDVEPDDRSS